VADAVLGAENFRLLAEQNRIRKEPILAARASSSIARAASRRQLSLHLLLLVREQNTTSTRSAAHRQGARPRSRTAPGTLRRYRAAPGYQPIPIKAEITPDEQPS